MTLVITELSNEGIVMAADSAITRFSNGRIVEVDEQGWTKLLKVPSIKAAISYWGCIGAVTPIQFDLWLKRVIGAGNYTDLESFADYLAAMLNEATHGRPLQDGQDVGIHVAGYSEWSDGNRHPFFYHIHNGHGTIEIRYERDNIGRILTVNPQWVADPRKLFEKHQDFPATHLSVEQNLANLQLGYITRNGAYFMYAILWQQMLEAIQYLNRVPRFSIPRNPTSLNSRKGYVHVMLQTIISLYRCSNQSRIIGGKVSSLAIGPNGYLT